MPESDAALLQRFAATGDEGAFAELARRHSGLVFSTARRRGLPPETAGEVTQTVLAALARKAPALRVPHSLAPWLHRAAVLESAAALRRETRYRDALRRQEEAATMTPDPALEETTAAWASVRPLVDEELNALSAADREVLLWHHVEGRTFRDIAARLGVSAEAAQRRGHRALEKLATRLRRRGVAVPVVLLGGALSAGLAGEATAAQAAAVSLAGPALLQSRALAEAARHGSAWSASGWAASPAALVVAGVLSAGLPLWWQAQAARHASPPASLSPNHAAGENSPTLSGETRSTDTPPPEITPASRLAYLRQAIEHLKTTDPQASPTKLDLQLRRYMLTLSAEDLPEVARMFSGAPRAHRGMSQVIAAFSTRLAELEPDLALELAQATSGKHPNPDFANSIDKKSLLDVLVRTHTAAFRQAVAQDTKFGKSALESWAKYDPEAAINYVETSFAGDQRIEAYTPIMVYWFINDPAAATRWLDMHAVEKPDVVNRVNASLYGGLGRWLAQQMPPSQAVALTTSITDPLLRNLTIESLSQQYFRRHPEALAGLTPWLRMEDEGKPLSVGTVVNYWRQKDEPGVAAWVDGLPEGELKTTALRHLAAKNPSDKTAP